MNRSILFLQYSQQSASPLFSFSHNTRTVNLGIHNSFFYKQFSHVFFGNTANCLNKIYSTIFKEFVTTPIYLHMEYEYKIQNEIWEKERNSFAVGNLFIESSKFIKCNVKYGSGGAVLSLCDSNITNSQFVKCHARFGGGVSVNADLISSKNIFSECSSEEGSGIYHKTGIINTNFTTFIQCSSSECGSGISSFRSISHKSISTNVSYSFSKQNSVCFHLYKSKTLVSHSLFTYNYLHRGSGGITFESSEKSNIDSVIFHRISYDDIVGGGATCINAKNLKSPLSVAHSCFSLTAGKTFWSICVDQKSQILFEDCHFSYSLLQEISGNIDFKENYSSKFDQLLQIQKNHHLLTSKERKIPSIEENDQINLVANLVANVIFWVMLVLMIGIALSELYDLYLKRKFKRPKALE